MNDKYYKEWISYIRHKRFSVSTYRTYTSSVEWFLGKCTKEPSLYTEHDIREMLISLKNKNTVNSTITAIRQFYIHILCIELDWRKLPYTAKQVKIQPIYTQEEAINILDATKSTKQKAILSLIIDCGLRISEPCSIFISDCSSKEMRITLRSTKGDKDRVVYPSAHVWSLIKTYWNTWHRKPKKYLFEGQYIGSPYTSESIRAFVMRSCAISGVQYKGVHAFRRFSGTWLVQNGIPETVVADRLGHNSVKTLHKHYLIHSPIYLKNIISPLNTKHETLNRNACQV